MTKVGDVVLVYMDNNPAFFARVEEISADVKPGWFQVKLLVLQVPLLVVTWILREALLQRRGIHDGGPADADRKSGCSRRKRYHP